MAPCVHQEVLFEPVDCNLTLRVRQRDTEPQRCIFPKTDAVESVSTSRSSLPALTTTKAKFKALSPCGVIRIVPVQLVFSV